MPTRVGGDAPGAAAGRRLGRCSGTRRSPGTWRRAHRGSSRPPEQISSDLPDSGAVAMTPARSGDGKRAGESPRWAQHSSGRSPRASSGRSSLFTLGWKRRRSEPRRLGGPGACNTGRRRGGRWQPGLGAGAARWVLGHSGAG